MLYNPEYALRLCSQYGRIQSCIHLYSLMGLYEEAVHLALKVIFFICQMIKKKLMIIYVNFFFLRLAI